MIAWPTIDVRGKTIQIVALELALWCTRQGFGEDGRPNRGVFPDECHRAAGLRPEAAQPWCTSAWIVIYAEAARQMGIESPFPCTAKAVRVLDLVDPVCIDSNPAPGALYVLAHGDAWKRQLWNSVRRVTGGRLTDLGHLGAAAELDGPNVTLDVSANTNAKGLREGDRWACHEGDPSASHKGTILAWVHLGRAPLRALVA